MNIYLELLLLTLAVVYIVGVSGFTNSWRALLARFIGIHPDHLRALPPFDCEKCMTFWACCIFALVTRRFSLPVFAASCGFSLFAFPLRQIMIFIQNTVLKWIKL